MADRYDVFISYSNLDKDLASELYDKLEEAGLKCFKASKDIGAGIRFEDKIRQALEHSEIALFLITPNVIRNGSDWVKLESGAAWVLQKTIITAHRYVERRNLNEILRLYQTRNIAPPNSLEKLVDEISAIVDFSAFWRFFLGRADPGEKIYVALSAKVGMEYEKGRPTGKMGHTDLVSYNELEAFLKLQKEIAQAKEIMSVVHGGVYVAKESEGDVIEVPELPLKTIGDDTFVDPERTDFKIPPFPLNKNLIVVGSPNASQVCRHFMKLYEPPFKFETREKEGSTEKIIETEQGSFPAPSANPTNVDPSEPDKLKEDYCVILRATNPFDKSGKNKVLILAGNHGFGTQAVLRFVADRKKIKKLRDEVRDDDFAALYKATVYKNKEAEIVTEPLQIARLVGGTWQTTLYNTL